VTSSKSYDYKKNTISRLFAIQALFQMEANGKSYRTIKNELKETFYMGQIQGSEIFKPNYLLSQKIIEQATKNQIKIDTKINMAFNNLWNIKTIDTTLRAILRAASAETLNKKTPKKVILSEYISITGTFYPSGQEQKLVNGLLNKIIEDLQI
jgi:N utilization substance protein B|tara:strand:- start:626 stop:1084 length:459 start_codon:yes stop_codon:yes gene_type:complete